MATCIPSSTSRVVVRSRDPVVRAPQIWNWAPRLARTAGSTANATVVTRTMVVVKARTRQSRLTSRMIGSVRVLSTAMTASCAKRASRSPAAAPAHAIRVPSITSCLTTRSVVAPSAKRSASSASRVVARTSERLATLAQAVSRTSPAIARRNQSGS
jgi:hypothetical protein